MDFHDYPGASDGGSLEDFVTKHGIATDLALNFARAAFCARLPITERMLDEVIDFLNDKNREYAEGEADYNWSVWADNCVHTLRNALAAANIWSPLSVRAVKFLQLFNLAVPANEFVNLAELGNEGNIADYEQIQQDDPQRDALHEFNWLPTRHGALLKTLPVYEPNDLYDTTFRLFTLSRRSGWARPSMRSSFCRTIASSSSTRTFGIFGTNTTRSLRNMMSFAIGWRAFAARPTAEWSAFTTNTSRRSAPRWKPC